MSASCLLTFVEGPSMDGDERAELTQMVSLERLSLRSSAKNGFVQEIEAV